MSLSKAGHEMDDETILTHVMAPQPQEEYQDRILTLKAKLREDNLAIEEAETLLDGRYEAMKEFQGWTEDGDELHWQATFQENTQRHNVDIVVNMV